MFQKRQILTVFLVALLLFCFTASAAETDPLPIGSEPPADGVDVGSAPPGAISNKPESSVLTGRTANEIVSMMGLGFNIGNTFDATGGTLKDHETRWGNPAVTQKLVDAIYDAGFDTVRLPVTWMDFISKDGTYTIDPEYLARVKEVVDYCYNDNLFVIINAHHESWINISDLDVSYKQVGEELNAVWTQIATYFANYDQHLIFEGMNEPRMANTNEEWTGKGEAYSAVNYLNQIFVNAVRSNGLGNNNERCLMVTGYAAQSSLNILRSIALPTYNGNPVNNLIVSVHSYTPYEFCLTDKKKNFSLTSGSDTGSVNTVFRDINDIFLKYGIPVIMGETGATNSGGNTEARVNWAYYTSKTAASYGVPIILWDNGAGGSSGGECHRYIDRKTGNLTFPEIIDALKRGQSEASRGSMVHITDPNPALDPTSEGRNLTYMMNGRTIGSGTSGAPSVNAPEGMRFLGWYTRPDYLPGSEFNGKTVPATTSTVYAKLGLSSYKKYKTTLTPAALPVIEPRDTRPSPTPTPTPSPTPTETPVVTETVTPSPTGIPSPTATPDGSSVSDNPVTLPIILALIMCLIMIGMGVFLVIRGIRNRHK